MKTGIFLSYKGLGANLMHLSYCHQIAKKFGPVVLLTLNSKLSEILIDDPNFSEIICLNNYHKKLVDIFKLSKIFKKLGLENLFIYYPSLRYVLAGKIAGIKNIHHYPIFKKKNLHLVEAAKTFTEIKLNIKNCPTESKIIQNKKIEKLNNINNKKIILGIGSSGPTTKWGSKNYTSLIKKLSKINKFYFFLLCGPEEENEAKKIIENVDSDNCMSLSKKSISEVKDYISHCDLYIGNDSFGHHISCQMGIPCFIILLDTPRAYSDYSVNQNRIIPPNTVLDQITHDSKLDPNSISVEMVLDKIKNFI